jgi:type II secretory pathway pseudopilin PulG
VNAANAANVEPSDGVFWTVRDEVPTSPTDGGLLIWALSGVRYARVNRRGAGAGHARDFGRTAGFTLLEICFVLFIVAVLFAVAAPPVAKQFQEEQIRKPVRELQTFAKTARRLAMEQNRVYVILLLNNGFLLEPLEKKDTDTQSLRYDLPNHVTFEIQRPSDRSLERIADARWVFTPNGLCEPITFFFQRDQDWVRFRIDALTARMENEESFIR